MSETIIKVLPDISYYSSGNIYPYHDAQRGWTNVSLVAEIERDGWTFPIFKNEQGQYAIDLGGAIGLSDWCDFKSKKAAIECFASQL